MALRVLSYQTALRQISGSISRMTFTRYVQTTATPLQPLSRWEATLRQKSAQPTWPSLQSPLISKGRSKPENAFAVFGGCCYVYQAEIGQGSGSDEEACLRKSTRSSSVISRSPN